MSQGNPFQIVSNPKPVPPGAVKEKDPVCHMDVYPPNAAGSHEHHGKKYYFCSKGCLEKFRTDPHRFLAPVTPVAPTAAELQREYVCPMDPEVSQIGPGACPKCGMALEPKVASLDDDENPELDDMRRRLWISTMLTVPLMLMAMGGMSLAHGTGRWMVLLQLAFSTPVVLWAGYPFFERGWKSIISRSPSMRLCGL